jgi:hypothetical protein
MVGLKVMRTTVDIPDAKYRQLKTKAASEGTTVKALVLKGVEVLLTQKATSQRRPLKLPLVKSSRPGSIDIDNEQIYDLIGFP